MRNWFTLKLVVSTHFSLVVHSSFSFNARFDVYQQQRENKNLLEPFSILWLLLRYDCTHRRNALRKDITMVRTISVEKRKLSYRNKRKEISKLLSVHVPTNRTFSFLYHSRTGKRTFQLTSGEYVMSSIFFSVYITSTSSFLVGLSILFSRIPPWMSSRCFNAPFREARFTSRNFHIKLPKLPSPSSM